MSIMIKFTILLSILIISISFLLSHRSSYPVQLGVVGDEGERKSQYECGIEPFEEELGIETRERFFIKFYKIGIIFLIFDLESLLLYPITVILYNKVTTNVDISKLFIVFLIFMAILVLGLIYEYRKKVI